MVWKETNFDLPKVQSELRHLYPDGLSRNKTGRIAGRGTILILAAPSAFPDPSLIICPNCGKAWHYRSGCSVPAKAHTKSNKPAITWIAGQCWAKVVYYCA